jgi:hypothetical protein
VLGIDERQRRADEKSPEAAAKRGARGARRDLRQRDDEDGRCRGNEAMGAAMLREKRTGEQREPR